MREEQKEVPREEGAVCDETFSRGFGSTRVVVLFVRFMFAHQCGDADRCHKVVDRVARAQLRDLSL